MNKFIIFASFFVVTSLHILLFLYYRNTPIITSLPNISNPTIQFQLTKITEVEKPIEKPAIEEKKEIVKEIKKEEIQKPTEKIKALEKETPKKVEKEKVQVKEEIKETLQKTSENIEEVKEIKKTIPNEQNTKETIKPSPKIDHQENMLIDKYASKLREEINKNKTYPTISKKLHEQGSVIVSFRVLKSGEFINIRLISSSNKERLDKAALNALYDTKEFEVFDKEINKEFLDFNLPLEFKLN